MGSPDRLVRVNEILKRALADYLEKNILLKDSGIITTVVSVKVSCNLRSAAVKVSVLGNPEAKHKAMSLLHQARSDLQRRIARDLTMKYTPVLHFELDETIERGDRVLELIRELENKNAGESQ